MRHRQGVVEVGQYRQGPGADVLIVIIPGHPGEEFHRGRSLVGLPETAGRIDDEAPGIDALFVPVEPGQRFESGAPPPVTEGTDRA